METGSSVVDQIGQMAIEGDITPPSWYLHITFANGKADRLAIDILSDIVYWYRPVEVREEGSGRLVGWRKKFAADMLQRSYQQFANQFGCTKREACAAVHRLRDRNLVVVEFRTLRLPGGLVLSNVMFIAPVVETVKQITYRPPGKKGTPPTSGCERPHLETGEVSHLNGGPVASGGERCSTRTLDLSREDVGAPTLERETYTETPTETPTDESERARRKPRRGRPPTNDPTLDHLGVIYLEEQGDVQLGRAARREIARLVPADGEGLDWWKCCVRLWLCHPYQANNVSGILDWWQHPEKAIAKSHDSMGEQERMLAERARTRYVSGPYGAYVQS